MRQTNAFTIFPQRRKDWVEQQGFCGAAMHCRGKSSIPTNPDTEILARSGLKSMLRHNIQNASHEQCRNGPAVTVLVRNRQAKFPRRPILPVEGACLVAGLVASTCLVAGKLSAADNISHRQADKLPPLFWRVLATPALPNNPSCPKKCLADIAVWCLCRPCVGRLRVVGSDFLETLLYLLKVPV